MNIPSVVFRDIPVSGCCRLYADSSGLPTSKVRCLLHRRNLLTAALLLAASVGSFAYAHSDGAKLNGDAKRVRKSCPPAPAVHGTSAEGPVLIGPAPVDPAIQRALDGVSPAHIEHTITTLAGFRNRNTLSSMDTDLLPGQGIT
ncbi:MAG TPA: hypothetical protein VGD64_00945, partial [Acidisarcina sp.]